MAYGVAVARGRMMLPGWAPNLHPLVIHFPIVFLLTALAADGMHVLSWGPDWFRPMATSLYAVGGAGAALAYWTGTRAAATVFVPGMAHPLIEDHRVWALGTTIFVAGLALAHVATRLTGRDGPRHVRLALVLAGLLGAILVQQTAERGARLVFEQGVGVVTAPPTR